MTNTELNIYTNHKYDNSRLLPEPGTKIIFCPTAPTGRQIVVITRDKDGTFTERFAKFSTLNPNRTNRVDIPGNSISKHPVLEARLPLNDKDTKDDLTKKMLEGIDYTIDLCYFENEIVPSDYRRSEGDNPKLYTEAPVYLLDGYTRRSILEELGKLDTKLECYIRKMVDENAAGLWMDDNQVARRNIDRNKIKARNGRTVQQIEAAQEKANKIIEEETGSRVGNNTKGERRELLNDLTEKIIANEDRGVEVSTEDSIEDIINSEAELSYSRKKDIEAVSKLTKPKKARDKGFSSDLEQLKEDGYQDVVDMFLEDEIPASLSKDAVELVQYSKEAFEDAIYSSTPVKNVKLALATERKKETDRGEFTVPPLSIAGQSALQRFENGEVVVMNAKDDPALCVMMIDSGRGAYVGSNGNVFNEATPRFKGKDLMWKHPHKIKPSIGTIEMRVMMLYAHICLNDELINGLPDLKGKMLFTDEADLSCAMLIARMANGITGIADFLENPALVGAINDTGGYIRKEGVFKRDIFRVPANSDTATRTIIPEGKRSREIPRALEDRKPGKKVLSLFEYWVKPVAALPPETPEGWDDAKAEEDEFYEVYNVPDEDEISDEEYLEYSDTIRTGTKKREFFKRTYLKEADVSKHWKELSKKHHPDLGGKDSDMAQINAEYKVLMAKARIREKII